MTSASPALVARIVTDEPARVAVRTPRRHTVARRLTTAAMVLLVAFLTMMGFNGGTQPAQAFLGIDITGPFCSDTNPGPFLFRDGTASLVPMVNGTDGDLVQTGRVDGSYAGSDVTAYEWFSTSGLRWTTYDDGEGNNQGGDGTKCWGVMNTLGTWVANNVFDMSKMTVVLSIGMYQWASSDHLLDMFMQPLDCMLAGEHDGSPCGMPGGLSQNLYLEFLTPVILLGALWMGWVGLVKKRTTESAQGAVWMIGSAIFALWFMASPSTIAGWGTGLVSDVNSKAMEAVTSASSSTLGTEDMCHLANDSDKKTGPRTAACSIYKALLFTPWASGQFGQDGATAIPGPDGQSMMIGNKTETDSRLLQLEAQALNHDEMNALFSTGGDHRSYKDIKAEDDKKWKAVADQANSEDSAWGTVWRGEEPGSRINIAFAALFASACAGMLILIMSFTQVILGVGMLMLMMVAPLFLLIGAHPGFGRGIALKWLEMLLGTVIKRIAVGFLLAMVIGTYQVILAAPMSWFAHIMMILAVGIGSIMYRKPILEAMNVVNLGGSKSGLEGDDAKQKAKKGLGFGVGAIAGAMAGGGVMGAVQGGISGQRTGSPIRAGSIGAGAGRRVASRANAKAERERKADDPFELEREKTKEQREAARLQGLVNSAYAEDGDPDEQAEMKRRLKAYADRTGKKLPRPEKDVPQEEGVGPKASGSGSGGSGSGGGRGTGGGSPVAGAGAGAGAAVGAGAAAAAAANGGAGAAGAAAGAAAAGGSVPRPSGGTDRKVTEQLDTLVDGQNKAADELDRVRDQQQRDASTLGEVEESVEQQRLAGQRANSIAQDYIRRASSQRNQGPRPPAPGGTSGGSASGGTRRPSGGA